MTLEYAQLDQLFLRFIFCTWISTPEPPQSPSRNIGLPEIEFSSEFWEEKLFDILHSTEWATRTKSARGNPESLKIVSLFQ